jgi:Skp family chaperone for outer membrane proteins
MKYRLLVSLLAICALLALSHQTMAQGTARGTFYTKKDVERIIKRVEDRSDAFRKVIDKSLDRSGLNGTRREDNINEQVKELENAIDKLKSDFSRANTWQETREQVQTVMNEADEVNAIVRRGRWPRGGPVKSEWALVRSDLNKLAGVYNLRQLVP